MSIESSDLSKFQIMLSNRKLTKYQSIRRWQHFSPIFISIRYLLHRKWKVVFEKMEPHLGLLFRPSPMVTETRRGRLGSPNWKNPPSPFCKIPARERAIISSTTQPRWHGISFVNLQPLFGYVDNTIFKQDARISFPRYRLTNQCTYYTWCLMWRAMKEFNNK